MAHIAVISEHHLNDGQAIADLLERYFPEQATYAPILQKYKGSKLGNKGFYRDLSVLQDNVYFVFFIVIKDLDNDNKLEEINAFFTKCTNYLDNKTVNLLFVYMIEALALADFSAVCAYYNKDIKKISVNQKARNAKEALQMTFGYTESDMRKLVFAFDTNILKQNYKVWADFLTAFEQKLLEY
jgi:hypothetical protein